MGQPSKDPWTQEGVSKITGNVAVKEQFSKIAVNHTVNLGITNGFEVWTHQTGSLQHSVSIHSWHFISTWSL